MIRENDPCDDWPKPLILKAAGLQPCGCPLGVVRCACVERAGADFGQRSLLGQSGAYDTGRMIDRAPGAE